MAQNNTDIFLKEGSLLSVVINVPSDIDLSAYNSKIQVKSDIVDSVPDFEFSSVSGTTTHIDNQILWDIPPTLTVGKAGKYLWQLMLYSDSSDVIKFGIYNLYITAAVVNL